MVKTIIRINNLELDRFYTQDELCSLISKSNAWAERSRWSGIGPAYHKLGRRVVYLGSDILKWIDTGRIETNVA